MKRISLDHSKAERQEQLIRSCVITGEECKRKLKKQRRHYTINSKNFSKIPEDEDLGVLSKHPLRRG